MQFADTFYHLPHFLKLYFIAFNIRQMRNLFRKFVILVFACKFQLLLIDDMTNMGIIFICLLKDWPFICRL